MDQFQAILLNNNIHMFNTRFSGLDGTNSVSGECNGLQRMIHKVALFSIYVNCKCHRLVLFFKYCFINILGLNFNL